MYSVKNEEIHPSIREYFDRPINFKPKGFLFSPKYRQANDVLSDQASGMNSKRSFKRS